MTGLPNVWGEDVPPVPTLEPPKTIADAIMRMHQMAEHMDRSISRMEKMHQLELQTPEMHPVQINPGNNGQYTTIDRSPWIAKSVGILNPGSTAVYLGIGGASANETALAPSCPGNSSLVLPVEAGDLELGCDAATLGANTALIFVFRFVTVQPLVLRQVP